MNWLLGLADRLWTPWLLGLFGLVGLYYSVCTGFFQLFGVRRWIGDTLLSRRERTGQRDGITPVQSLFAALASTMGTGSIAGVATAISCGGPGAVFWMWVCAVLGMMTGCAEKILTLLYREGKGDKRRGGPMYYLANALHSPFLAGVWCLACMGGALTGGGLVQSGSMAQALNGALGLPPGWVSIAAAILAGAVIAGGLGRIARVSQLLVPVMGGVLLTGGVVVLWTERAIMPQVLSSIFACALAPRSALGGACGYTAMEAMRYGVARGVFTNEAGMGSTALAHAGAKVRHPVHQGMWAMVEVFVATLVVCTVTALVILTAGAYDPTLPGTVTGVELTARSFQAVLGISGRWVVTASVVLFAFTSIVGWCYYGQTAARWLFGSVGGRVWPAVFLAVTAAGGLWDVRRLWQSVDLFTALMSLPNLVALLVLSPQVLRCFWDYINNKAA
ncbi:MAG: alanine:cation symporter family protein [Oscillospiraceae bacterium]|nr:alanine:cation symporter family protein [Oscillospiraceae bacterium]